MFAKPWNEVRRYSQPASGLLKRLLDCGNHQVTMEFPNRCGYKVRRVTHRKVVALLDDYLPRLGI